MWPIIGGLLSGGASLLGSIFSSDTSAANTQANIAGQQQMQQETQKFNAEQADINRQFQASQVAQQRDYETQMSNTAYQRSRADMAAAGLNPILAAGAGGASTPSISAAGGSTAAVGTPVYPHSERTSPLAGLGDAVSRAFNSALSVKTLDKMTEEVANLQVDRVRQKAETELTDQRRLTEAQETARRGLEKQLLESRLPEAHLNSAKYSDIIANMPDWAKRSIWWTDYGGDAASKLVNTAASALRLVPGRMGQKFDDFWRDRTGWSR